VVQGLGAGRVQADDVPLDHVAGAVAAAEGDAGTVVRPLAVGGDDVARPGARDVGQSPDQDVWGIDLDADVGVGLGHLPGAVGADVVALDDQTVGVPPVGDDAEADIGGDDVRGRRRGAADGDVPRVKGNQDAVELVPQGGGAVGAETDGVPLDEGRGRSGDAYRRIIEVNALEGVAGDDVPRAGRGAADGV